MFGLKERRAGPRTEEQANAKARSFSVIFITFALPALIVFLIYHFQFRQLVDTDTMDMAQVARNMAAGRGFITSAVRPVFTNFEKDVLRMPDLVNAPLYPLAMRFVVGQSNSDLRVFLTSVLFFFLTIPLLYTLARAMFNQKVAYLSLFAYATSTTVLAAMRLAGSAMMAGFMFTALCLALYRYAQAAAPGGTGEAGEESETGRPDRRRVIQTAAVAGVLAAFCYLTDYMLLFAFLPAALYVYLAGGRMRKTGLGAFLVAFLVPAGFWMIRNMTHGVNPFFGARSLEIGMVTVAHPGLTLYRTTVPQSFFSLLDESKMEILRKYLLGIMATYQTLPGLGQAWLVPFFIVGLFYSFRRVGVNAVRGFVLAAFVCVVVGGSIFLFNASTLIAFIPVVLAFAAAYFVRLLTDARLPGVLNRSVMTGAVILLVMPLLSSLYFNRASVAQPHAEADLMQRVAQNVPIYADRAQEVAWYSGRTTVWLPDSEKDIKEMAKRTKFAAIYLSAATPSYQGELGGWATVYRQIGVPAAQYIRAGGKQPYRMPYISKGIFAGFAPFRGMKIEEDAQYLARGSLLLLTQDGAPDK